MILRMALRNALRNVKRSALTASTVVLGTALLTVALAWMDGVFGSLTEAVAQSAGHVRVVTVPYETREELFPLYEHLPDTAALRAAAEQVDGVVAVYARIVAPVTLTVGEEIGETFAPVSGVDPAWLGEVLDVESRLIAGRSIEAERGELLLGRGVADALGATVGDEVVLLGQTQDGALSAVSGRAVGIVTGAGATVDQTVFATLEEAQYLADLPEAATELLIYGDDRDDAYAVASSLREQRAFADLAVRTWDETPLVSAVIAVVRVVQGMISAIIVFICALAVWNTMMMSVLERTSEIGVLRAMGLTGRGTVVLFVVEGLGIALLGGLLGVVLGGAGATYLELHGIEFADRLVQNVRLPIQSRLYADMSLGVAGSAMALAVATALVGTAVPAWHAARVEPVEAMRHGG